MLLLLMLLPKQMMILDFEANDLAVTNILKIAGVSSIAAGDFADAEFDII